MMNVAMKTAFLLSVLILLSLQEVESRKSRRVFGGSGRRRAPSSSYPKQKQWSSWSSSGSSSSNYPKQQPWSSWGNTGSSGSSWGNSGSRANSGSSWGNSGSSWANSGSSWGNSGSSSRSRKRFGTSHVATAAVAGLAGLYGGHVLTSMAYNSFGSGYHGYNYNYGYNNYRPYYQSSSCRAGTCEVRFTVNDTVIPPPKDPTKTNVTIPPYAELVFVCRNGGTCDKSHICYNNVYLYNNKIYPDYPRVTAAATSMVDPAVSSSSTTQMSGPSRTAPVTTNITAANGTAATPAAGNVVKRQAPAAQPEMVQVCRGSSAMATAAYAFLVVMASLVALLAPGVGKNA